MLCRCYVFSQIKGKTLHEHGLQLALLLCSGTEPTIPGVPVCVCLKTFSAQFFYSGLRSSLANGLLKSLGPAEFHSGGALCAASPLTPQAPSPAFFCFQPTGVQAYVDLPLGPLCVWAPNQMENFHPPNRAQLGRKDGCRFSCRWLL